MTKMAKTPSALNKKKRFKVAAVGGTFDELHKGHGALILKAFDIGEHVIIGLSTDEFAKNLGKNHEIAPYEERSSELRSFLEEHGLTERTEILPLKDPYGPTVSSERIDALVVSRETEPRAHEINELRKKKDLRPLRIVTIEVVPADDRIAISSTRIRHGEIDRKGHLLRKEALE